MPDGRRPQILEENDHEITNRTISKARYPEEDRLDSHAADGGPRDFDGQPLSDPGPGRVLFRTKGDLYSSYHDPDRAHRSLHAGPQHRSVPVSARNPKRSLAPGPSVAGADLPAEHSVWRAQRSVHGADGVWRNAL